MNGFQITQIGYVVHDLEATVEVYRRTFGWGPWRIYDVVPPRHHDARLRGELVESGTRIAIATVGSLDIELIQPVLGPGQHAEHLARLGDGINHILVRNYEDGEERAIDVASLGLPVLMSGSFGPDVHYTYLDGRDSFATIIELVQGSTASAGMEPDAVVAANPEPAARILPVTAE